MISTAPVLAPDAVADIRSMLRLVRLNLGLDVAFVGEFSENRRTFRYVDAEHENGPVREGDADLLDNTYCARVVDGRLPELMRDAGHVAAARVLPVTLALPVGAHLSVPIRLSSGAVYGTFCCFGHKPDHSLNERDIAMLRTFAGVVAQRIDRDLQTESLRSLKRRQVRNLLEAGGPSIVYQPVFLVDGMRAVGSEALSRFPSDSGRSVDAWFADAAEVGLQTELELLAIRNALEGYRAVWSRHPVQLGINAAAGTILDARFAALLVGCPMDRIVIELTEHEKVTDYPALGEAFAALRRQGAKIAVDDVGAGYASMSHIVSVRPDIMKLDVGIVRSIDTDPMRAALATALVGFARQFDCRVVAEGVETQAELDLLRQLDVQAVQGYLLGRPMPIGDLLAVLDRERVAQG